jgi:hypothetical protein
MVKPLFSLKKGSKTGKPPMPTLKSIAKPSTAPMTGTPAMSGDQYQGQNRSPSLLAGNQYEGE